jgi:phosphatidylinositol-3-phosphatase
VLTGPDGPVQFCPECSAPLRPEQRYCLECGERVGPRAPELLALLARGSEQPAAATQAPVEAPGTQARVDPSIAAEALPLAETSSPPPRRVRGARPLSSLTGRIAALRLPSRRVSALLVLAFVGFGVLLGSVTGSRVENTLAASARPRLKLLLPAASDAASATEASPSASEPPASEAQATPEPASPEAAAPPAPASTTKASAPSRSSKGAGGGAGGGSRGGSGTAGGGAPQGAGGKSKLPAIEHVFVVMLSDEPYAATFGPESAAPYLARTLEGKGELLVRYYAVAHEQLADGIALLSGQGPTAATAANCPTYEALAPGTPGGEGQLLGEGCVYPATAPTLPGQLEVKHRTWRAYVQGIDEPGAAAAACAHPALGAPDPTSATPAAAQPYATFRNPFVYFQALSEAPTCASDDVGLNELGGDLSSAARTPSFSYIVPDRCHDGSPGPCPTGAAGGLPAASGFLEEVVPKILASKAYKESGLLVITTDEAPSSGEFADSSSCCGLPRFPNLPAPTGVAASLPAEGGGQVGALLISPFVKPHTTSQEPYSHFSLLRTIEDLFELKHLGYAGGAHVSSFEPSLFAAKPAK